MKRFSSLFLQDLLVAYRSGHVLITAIMLVIMLALVFFLPKKIDVQRELIYDGTPGQVLYACMAARGSPSGTLFGDRAQFDAALAGQPSMVGVIVTGDLAAPQVEIITQGALAEENIHLLQASLDSTLAELRGQPASAPPVELLRRPSPPVPFNLNLIPIMLIFEVVLLGFLIVAVMAFQETQEGTLRAYRVTPARALDYVLSKTALFIVLSLAYGGILLAAVFGASIHYPLILLVLALSSSLMTMLSLAVSVFYRNLSQWFFAGVAILLVNSLPMMSYAMPSFAPAWITWLPSYGAVFAARDILFRAAGLADVAPTLAYLLVGNLAALGASYWAVRSRLMKEAR